MALTRRRFLTATSNAAVGLAVPAGWTSQDGALPAGAARLRLMRNATCVVRYGGQTLLLDPMLSDAGARPPIARSPNPRPNPLVPLPIAAAAIVDGIDATLVTHTHFDHWDTPAIELLPRGTPLFAQPADRARFAEAGFTDVRVVDPSVSWAGITITRTGGQHGTGETGQRMGPVSGYVLARPGSPTVYIAGDTIWCPEVATAIRTHNPAVIVVNAGAAQFLEGGPIIMDVADVVNVCRAAPEATVIAVHLEAINHCVLTRTALRDGLTQAGVKSTVLIPRDGEELRLA
jgi:L-ascorbate metabolism protein UlaG (beta-lactamase superfamily)